jgi:hypothetical protein
MSRTFHHGRKQVRRYYNHPFLHWSSREPKAWRRLMKHKKRRVSCRQAAYEVMKGNTEVLWPLNRKPHIYYW